MLQGLLGARFQIGKNETLNVRGRLTAGSLAIRAANYWRNPTEAVVEVRSVCEFKGRLENTWLSAFGEGNVWIAGLRRMVERKACHQFSSFKEYWNESCSQIHGLLLHLGD